MTRTSLDRLQGALDSWRTASRRADAPMVGGRSVREVARSAANQAVAGRKVSEAANKVADTFAPETPFTRETLVRVFNDAAGKSGAAQEDDRVDDAADAVSDHLSTLAPGLSAELSGANMLPDAFRITAAAGFGILLILGGLLTWNVEGNASNGFYALMSTAAFLFVAAILVLIMGYGSVKLGSSTKGDT